MSGRARFCLGMCFDFIPISSYTALFNWTILFLILGAVYQAGTGGIFSASTARLDSLAGFLFVVALIMYMGARPVSAEFGDTINYAAEFQTLQQGEAGNWKAQLTGMKGEWLFAVILHAWAQHGNVHDYFLTCSAVYVGALALASYRIFRSPVVHSLPDYVRHVHLLGIRGQRRPQRHGRLRDDSGPHLPQQP